MLFISLSKSSIIIESQSLEHVYRCQGLRPAAPVGGSAAHDDWVHLRVGCRQHVVVLDTIADSNFLPMLRRQRFALPFTWEVRGSEWIFGEEWMMIWGSPRLLYIVLQVVEEVRDEGDWNSSSRGTKSCIFSWKIVSGWKADAFGKGGRLFGKRRTPFMKGGHLFWSKASAFGQRRPPLWTENNVQLPMHFRASSWHFWVSAKTRKL